MELKLQPIWDCKFVISCSESIIRTHPILALKTRIWFMMGKTDAKILINQMEPDDVTKWMHLSIHNNDKIRVGEKTRQCFWKVWGGFVPCILQGLAD